MEIKQVYWAGTVVLLGLVAWDNWRVREELEQLRQAQPVPAASALPAALAPQAQQSAQALPVDCPVLAPVGIARSAAAAAAAATGEPRLVAGQDTGVVEIPPGTDLAEAMKMFQREQAKAQPGAASISPFGPSR